MHLPLLPSIGNSEVYIKGDVSIDASAVLAPGVIIQADPDSQVIISAGVCIGMGTIIHAHKGTLKLEAGAVLGAGVLVVGNGKIGANACIGSVTTIWNSSIKSGQVVSPGSLIGEVGRQVEDTLEEAAVPVKEATEQESGQMVPNPAETPSDTPPSADLNGQEPPASAPQTGTSVYGQANLNRLLLTLFPHNKSAKLPPVDTSQSE